MRHVEMYSTNLFIKEYDNIVMKGGRRVHNGFMDFVVKVLKDKQKKNEDEKKENEKKEEDEKKEKEKKAKEEDAKKETSIFSRFLG